jgi:hypothetical protein
LPNGRHGDHPLTDLFNYGDRTFPNDICEMLLEIRTYTKQLNIFDGLGIDWNGLARGEGDLSQARGAISRLLLELRDKQKQD